MKSLQNVAPCRKIGVARLVKSFIIPSKLYKDKSVLEQHHLQVAFSLLSKDSCNILSKLDEEEHNYFKELVTGKQVLL